MKKKTKRNFTLVELLTVISVIAILTALLMPALSKAKQSVRSAACANNERQIGQAFSMYINDYNGYFPKAGDWMTVAVLPPLYNWPYVWGTLAPPVKEYGVLYCMTDQNPGLRNYSYGGEKRFYFSYGYNYLNLGGGVLMNGGVQLNKISTPSSKAAITDSSGTGMNQDGPSCPYFYYGTSFTGTWSIRHSLGSNVLYVDGHVKWDAYKFLFGNSSIY